MLEDCPFCHHKDSVLYARNQEERSGNFRDIYICKECKLLYPRPRMDEKESLEYQKRLYTEYSREKMKDPTKIIERQQGRKWEVSKGNLINILKLLQQNITVKDRALDIGTFSGEFCYLLQSIGFVAYGLELCDEAARFATKKGLRVFTGVFPDEIPIDLANIKFSLISMLECMYYIVDLKKGLERIHSMLDDNGVFLLKCHQGRSSYYSDKKISFFERYGDGVQGIPSVESLEYCLRKTGFEIIHMSGAITRASAPVNLDKLIEKNTPFKKIFISVESILNTIYETYLLKTKDAERLIVLARKK